jgi:hypothetical protein
MMMYVFAGVCVCVFGRQIPGRCADGMKEKKEKKSHEVPGGGVPLKYLLC